MYGKNLSPELAAQIAEEVEYFQLPPDWREERETVQGYTIDEEKSSVLDDALLATPHPDGSFTSTVSIADVGSFLAMPSAIRSLARRREQSWADRRGAYPLWPYEITDHYLGFRAGNERPAVTMYLSIDPEGGLGEPRMARTIIAAQKCRKERFDAAVLSDDPGQKPFRDLYDVARKLQRRNEKSTDHRKQQYSPNAAPSDLVTAEILRAANMSAGRFVVEHSIPAIYLLPKRSDREMAFLAADPGEENADPYVRITSPLRRFVDFVSQANIIAYLQDEAFPFGEDAIATIVGQYNQRKKAAKVPSILKAQGIRNAINDGTAHNKDLVNAFAIPDRIAGGAKIRQDAYKYAIANPDRIRPLIQALISSNCLVLRERKVDDVAQTSRVLQAENGTTYPYLSQVGQLKTQQEARRQIAQQRTDAQTLAKIARLTNMPELPWYLTDEASEILLAPRVLKKSAAKAGLKVTYESQTTAEGRVCMVALLEQNGQQVQGVEVTENTEQLARCKAAYLLEQAYASSR